MKKILKILSKKEMSKFSGSFEGIKPPRDAAHGGATGKRQHKPLVG